MFQPLIFTLALIGAAPGDTPAAATPAGPAGRKLSRPPQEQAPASSVDSFTLDHEAVVPVSPEEAFDLFTGDVSPWWDHTFSEKPHALVIEPRPGGSFFEWFDDEGNGVQHARVTWAQRGEKLVFQGPLGLHGLGLDLICSFSFEAVERDEAAEEGEAVDRGEAGTPGEATRVKAHIVGVGVIQPGWKEAVDGVWKHFLVDRYQPYVEGLAPRPAEDAPPVEDAPPAKGAPPAKESPSVEGAPPAKASPPGSAPAPRTRRRQQF